MDIPSRQDSTITRKLRRRRLQRPNRVVVKTKTEPKEKLTLDKILSEHTYLRRKHFKAVSVAKYYIKGFATTCDVMGLISKQTLKEVRKDVIAQLQKTNCR